MASGRLARKLPSAAREWIWQWVFPATSRWRDAATGMERRHHLHESAVQRAVRRAAVQSGIAKRVTCHTFRHSAAPAVMPSALPSRWYFASVFELAGRHNPALCPGHESIETTQMYLHADLQLKEEALSHTTPLGQKPGRYRPGDHLLAFLEQL